MSVFQHSVGVQRYSSLKNFSHISNNAFVRSYSSCGTSGDVIVVICLQQVDLRLSTWSVTKQDE